MERRKYCIFACGGQGSRMGADIPKQFLRIGDKTILQLSLERMMAAVGGLKVITVLPHGFMDFWREECRRNAPDLSQTVVEGGITRFHSVKNALEHIPDNSIVAVHDGVRPFVGTKLVAEMFRLAGEFPAVVPVVPVTDTVKILDSSLCEKDGRSADRSELFGAQTPQLFHGETLKAAYGQPYDTSFTDDASVVRKSGVQVHYVLGEKYNIKITTPEDLLLARALFPAL